MTNPAWTGLTIIAKSIPLGAWVSPRAEINGHPVPLNWGVNYIPAPIGIHHINLYMPWLWRYGKAQITVDNTAGPAPAAYYAVPFRTFTRGAIGLQPVKNPGLLIFISIFLVPLLLVALCCIGASLMGT